MVLTRSDEGIDAPDRRPGPGTRPRARIDGRLVAGAISAVLTVLAWRAQRHRRIEADHTDVVVLWLGSIATALIAVWPARSWTRLTAWAGRARRDIAIGTSLGTAFRDDSQIDRHSDFTTQVADHLARDVLAIDPVATVYFAAAPRMGWTSHPNVQFRVPRATGVDIVEGDPAPSIEPGSTTIFAALPERADELDDYRRRYPRGIRLLRVGEIGELYELYVIGPGASTAASLPPPR